MKNPTLNTIVTKSIESGNVTVTPGSYTLYEKALESGKNLKKFEASIILPNSAVALYGKGRVNPDYGYYVKRTIDAKSVALKPGSKDKNYIKYNG